jgi:uroporphyrinogen-III synthase
MAIQPIYLLATGLLPAELIEWVAAKGIVLDTMSLIATEPVGDEVLGARLRALGSRQLTAVFTSTNAVEAVKGWMNAAAGTGADVEGGPGTGSDVGADAVGVPGWRIFCIGGATRRAVADYFGEAAIAGTAESATALAEVVMADAGEERTREGAADTRSDRSVVGQDRNGGEKEIFFFCGDQRREELPAMLRAEGFKVNEWVIYRTILTPQKMERVYAGIAFFSPSAVESYFSLHTVADGVTLFAIGRTTAAAIQARCSRPVIISDRPGKEALVRTMTDYFQTNNKE